ncbi:hypothetical protein BASA83_010318 [Batrachochytrium salamandrivorans]|nr:hypothetical protein BASA83_010318 [Batrachochytrium salamandrivorans]
MAKQIWTSVGWTGLWSMNLWGRGIDNRALAARLADFLQVAYRQYQSHVEIPPGSHCGRSVRMRSTDSDRSVRATPKRPRDASPPPQDDLWVVVKNLSPASRCSAGRDGCFAQHYCSPAEGNSQPGENP